MQDQLYRKVMKNTTRIEDGYEVVEGIYGGRRVVQKRRIQLKEDIHSKKNKKMKNDYEDLISNCSAVEKDKY